MPSAAPRLLVPPALWLCAAAARADFPAPYDSQADDGKRMPAEQVAAAWKVPEGFQVSVFAAEPAVQQPIAACWDARGRLWVAENYTYSEAGKNFDLTLRDRIVILEDSDHDGRHDKRSVFADDLKMLTSVELGSGGVYALCPPELLWIPMKDDRPAGPPQVLLDGFTVIGRGSHHTFANGLKWGPDGWLYGRVGITSMCEVGVPGAPAAQRVKMNGGIWRYHPARKIFEAVCHGTTNPWGLDWDENGEGFFTNTVIGHVWHLIPGAHFKRMHGEDVNTRCYEFIDQIADHYHFDTGKGWTSSRNAANGSDELGGGHAHCGALIYKGSNWPEYWRGKLLTLNLHGRRINVERLERKGSSFVAKHEPDAFFCPDPWFRGIDLLEGPDGGVFVLDWSDTGECHDNDGVHRGSGRIYKIFHGAPASPEIPDWPTLDAAAVAKVALNANPWLSAQARWVLADRATALEPKQRAKLVGEVPIALRNLRKAEPVKSIWAMRATGAGFTSSANRDAGEAEHIARLRWQMDTPPPADASAPPHLTPSWADWARREHSTLAMLHLAGAFQQIRTPDSLEALKVLIARPEMKDDSTLALVAWASLEPWFPSAGFKPEAFFRAAESPRLRKLIARRAAEDGDAGALEPLLAAAAELGGLHAGDLAAGLDKAWQGRRNIPKPKGWDAFVESSRSVGSVGSDGSDLQATLQRIAARFEGGGGLLEEFRQIAQDGKQDLLARRNALQSLIDARAEGLHELCKKLIGEAAIAGVAARGLALSDDPAVGPLLAGRYKWSGVAKPVFLEVLASRPAWSMALLDAMAKNDIGAGDLPVFLARQIAASPDERLRARLREVWGEVRADDAGRRRQIAAWKARLPAETLAKADLKAGRVAFEQSCAVCHKLYGAGGEIGPDLTGGGRRNLDYLLENTVDPSAVVANEHRVSVVTLKDGRVLNGSLSRRDAPVMILRTLTAVENLDRNDVAKVEDLPQSLMPEGLLDALGPDRARDLIGYLMHDGQVEP